jgi:hypothetical protein
MRLEMENQLETYQERICVGNKQINLESILASLPPRSMPEPLFANKFCLIKLLYTPSATEFPFASRSSLLIPK